MYTFPNVFASEPTALDVLGAVSIIFWTITLITLVKYILIVMNLNDEGEGEHALSLALITVVKYILIMMTLNGNGGAYHAFPLEVALIACMQTCVTHHSDV